MKKIGKLFNNQRYLKILTNFTPCQGIGKLSQNFTSCKGIAILDNFTLCHDIRKNKKLYSVQMYWNIGKQYTLQKIVKYMKTTRLFIVHWYCIIDKTVQRYCNIGELCTLQSCKKNIENLDLA